MARKRTKRAGARTKAKGGDSGDDVADERSVDTRPSRSSPPGEQDGDEIVANDLYEPVNAAAEEERRKGNKEYHKKSYAKAIEYYTAGIALAARNPTFLVVLFSNRAAAYIGVKQFQKCISDCTAAISLDPESVKAHGRRAYAHFCLKNFAEAVSDYARAAELDPSNDQMRDNLERTKESLAEQRGGRSRAAESLEAPAGALPTVFSSGGENRGPEDESAALPLPSLAELPPLVRGRLEWRADFDDAFVPLSAAARALDEKQMGNEAFQRGDLRSALSHYTAAIRLYPDAIFYSNRAQVYLRLELYYDAIHDCSLSIERKPTTKAYLRRATAWAAVSEHEQAIESFCAALELEPRHQECRAGLQASLARLEAKGPVSKAIRAAVAKFV